MDGRSKSFLKLSLIQTADAKRRLVIASIELSSKTVSKMTCSSKNCSSNWSLRKRFVHKPFHPRKHEFTIQTHIRPKWCCGEVVGFPKGGGLRVGGGAQWGARNVGRREEGREEGKPRKSGGLRRVGGGTTFHVFHFSCSIFAFCSLGGLLVELWSWVRYTRIVRWVFSGVILCEPGGLSQNDPRSKRAVWVVHGLHPIWTKVCLTEKSIASKTSR